VALGSLCLFPFRAGGARGGVGGGLGGPGGGEGRGNIKVGKEGEGSGEGSSGKQELQSPHESHLSEGSGIKPKTSQQDVYKFDTSGSCNLRAALHGMDVF